MYKLIRFYNQNRKMIFKIILIIVFIIGIIQLLNWLTKLKSERKIQNNVMQNSSSVINNNSQEELLSNKSVISGEKISDYKLENDTDVIKSFMTYCNDRELESAYELLTDECKEEMFSTVDDFKEIYYIPIFNGNSKVYTLENWTDSTYKIEINDDVLATGKYEKENTVIDYITVKENDDGEYKLNINKYIGKSDIDKETEQDSINIKAIDSKIYTDYAIYTFEITNNSNRTILLDDLSNIDTVYLETKNGIKYSSYSHELTQEQLKIGVSEKKKISIKYYSKYTLNKKIDKAVFSKVILDYEKFKNLNNKSQFDNYSILEINV